MKPPPFKFLQFTVIYLFFIYLFSGLTRPSIYSFPGGQYPYPMLSPDMSQVAASW